MRIKTDENGKVTQRPDLVKLLKQINLHYAELFLYAEEFFERSIELEKNYHELVEKYDEQLEKRESLSRVSVSLKKEIALDLEKNKYLEA
jgi:hypothetical protein